MADPSIDAGPGVAAYEAGDYARAYDLLKPAADAGDLQARYLMARLSSINTPDRMSYPVALGYLDEGTRCQSPEALSLYGSLVGEVEGTERARIREAEIYKEAAEAGSLEALKNLGYLLVKHLKKPFLGGAYLLQASRLGNTQSRMFINALKGDEKLSAAIERFELIEEEQAFGYRWPLLDNDSRECDFLKVR